MTVGLEGVGVVVLVCGGVVCLGTGLGRSVTQESTKNWRTCASHSGDSPLAPRSLGGSSFRPL